MRESSANLAQVNERIHFNARPVSAIEPEALVVCSSGISRAVRSSRPSDRGRNVRARSTLPVDTVHEKRVCLSRNPHRTAPCAGRTAAQYGERRDDRP